jgi:23S rRNA (cytosine1962-C5)-methyltransferase
MKAVTAYLRKKPQPRAEVGHPWVFAAEVARCEGEPSVDGAVFVRSAGGRFLGSALFSPRSSICLRIFSRQKIFLDEKLIREKIEKASKSRFFTGGETARLVWSEADGLPGLTIDAFDGRAVVFQITHAAMEQKRPSIIQAIKDILRPDTLVERSDGAGRKFEGLPERKELLLGKNMLIEARIGAARFPVDLMSDQKSGAYLDQATNYLRVASCCAGKSVLDCFCNKGGFAINAALAGAKRVVAVDISQDAIDSAKKAAELNRVSIETSVANVFDDLRAREKSREKWDVIVLDPPPFSRSRNSLESAIRGYREINLRAFKLLQPGGLLATYTCSHHIQPREFLQMLREAAWDARRDAVIIEDQFQAPDHPTLLAMPESRYLHGWMIRVL